MTSQKATKRHLELRYEYGFIAPSRHKELVVCASLQEAQFFAGIGAQLMLRQVEIRTGEWEPIELDGES